MKSFRLDRQSCSDLIESWPAIVAAVAVSGGLTYFGWFDPVWRIVLLLFAGCYFGYVLRGRLTTKLRERYPNARYHALLSVGFSVMTLGVLIRMAFRETQGGPLDIAWLTVSFLCILTFVVVNRRDPDVFR